MTGKNQKYKIKLLYASEEYCSNCDETIEMTHRMEKCPNCDEYVVACNACIRSETGCGDCTDARRFKNRPAE